MFIRMVLYTFLTNLHSTWCTFCEEFQLANDQSNTWLSGNPSAVPTGAHPYWICSNREAACTQVVLRSDVSYTLMYYQAATYSDLLSSIMVFPTLSYLTMHSELLSFAFILFSGYFLQSFHITVQYKLKHSICNIIIN